MNKLKKFLVGAAAGAMILGSTVTAFADLETNGSFENGTVDPTPFVTLTSGDSTSISGWTVSSGTIDYIDEYWEASDPTRSIDLSGNEAGSISQDVPTVAGETYEVTFDMSGNPDDDPGIKTLNATADGGQLDTFTFDTTIGNTHENMMWEGKTYTFVADDISTTLMFASDTPTAFGPALDNVVVTAVGEEPTVDIPEQCNQTADFYNVIEGTDGSDNITGTNGPDLILAMGGSDKVTGNSGADCIVGGEGSDKLIGNNGDDVILGGAGSDSIEGNNGEDDLYGQEGSDSLTGGNDADNLWGGEDSDSLRGENGVDVLNGDEGSDSLRGGNGNDTLTGGDGIDSARGEAGNNDTCDAESEQTCEE